MFESESTVRNPVISTHKNDSQESDINVTMHPSPEQGYLALAGVLVFVLRERP